MRQRAGFVAFLVVILFATTAVAAEFDHSHTRFSLVLQEVVKDGNVDYSLLANGSENLEKYIKETGKVKKGTYELFTSRQKIAYWVNLYNAITILSIAEHYPVLPDKYNTLYPKSSIRQIPGIWNRNKFRTALGMKTLNQISSEQIEAFREPLLWFVVVNGSKGGAKILNRPIDPERLPEQLEQSARAFVLDSNNVTGDPGGKKLYLSRLFLWKASQFIPRYYKLGHFKHRNKSEIAVLNFLNQYAGMTEKMMIHRDDFTIEYVDYDWALNER
jgi:hypothetical protein